MKKIQKRLRPDQDPDQVEQDEGFATYEEELMQPLNVTLDEIQEDLRRFVDRFPWDIVPHITENNEVNDIIHNYKGTIQAAVKKEQRRVQMIDKAIPPSEVMEMNQKISIDQKKPPARADDLVDIKLDLREEKMARMIGLVCHLVYWNLYGDRLNKLPLDAYHKRLLFIQIS